MFNFNLPIWFYPTPVDFRRQIDGLVMFIADHLDMKPTGGQLFVFRNRSANKIKLLWYDRNGFWLCYKRIEKGKLHFPSRREEVMELSREVSAASTTFFLMRNLSERICFFIVITNKRGNHDKPYLSARDRSILEKTYHGLRAIDAIKSGLRESACIKL